MELYDHIGRDYNSTRKPDPFIMERIIYHLSNKNSLPCKMLDVGCGTGNYTIPLACLGFDFTGIDPSDLMLKEAGLKSDQVDWVQGTAEELAFSPGSFDAVLCMLTIHHWKSLEKGIENIFKTLKKQGRLVIFTSTAKQMEGYWLNHYFPEMMKKSVAAMPSFDLIKDRCIKSGFYSVEAEKYLIQEGLQDLFLFSGKNNPSLYFNADIRKGISSFADCKNENEISTGLEKLRMDLQTGYFDTIKNKYTSGSGDYLFVIASKRA
jgi:ubiquinone/menaquinone biosynthesis C-methylase UbiE